MISDSAPHLKKKIFESPSPRQPQDTLSPGGRLEVSVLFSSIEGTIAALKCATSLVKGLNGRITLVEVQRVPYPLPLNRPAVALDFTQQRLLAVAAQSELDIEVSLYLCRLPWETLARVLKPRSIIVIGCRRQWWRSREEKLASKLHRAGYHPVLVKAS